MKTGLALVGLGRWAMMLHGFLREVDGVEVLAGYDRDPAAAQLFSQVLDLPLARSLGEVCRNPAVRGVIIATSNGHHRPAAAQCLRAGKDVFIEKPITTTVAAADALIRLAAERGRVLMVGHNSRRYPAVRRLKLLLDGGSLGRVISLEGVFSYENLAEISGPGWRNDPRQCPGGPLLQLGVHHADNLMYLGGPVQRVYGELLDPVPGGRVPAGGRLLLRFASGAVGSIASDYCTTPTAVTITVRGSQGEARVLGEHTLQLVRPGGEIEEVQAEGPAPVQEELAEFARCIGDRSRPETDGQVGREALRLILAGLRSARLGRPVSLD